jgi:hypothetical protein
MCIHVKGLVSLKFILLYLALVIFIITDNQDFIPEACVSRESHYNKHFFIYFHWSLSHSLCFISCCLIFILPSFLHLFILLSTLLFFITSIYVCIWYSFLHIMLRMIWIWTEVIEESHTVVAVRYWKQNTLQPIQKNCSSW